MDAEVLGRVRAGRSGKEYEVKWNPRTGDVYVSYAGWKRLDRASSAGEAMRRAEAWLYDK